MYIFVGDCPSAKNKFKNVPFVGTQSYVVLCPWFAILHVDVSRVELQNQCDLHSKYLKHRWVTDTVIALGEKASKKLKDLDIPHFKLPHPSPKNRKLNDESYVNKVMKECYEYIHGRSK